MLTNMHSAALSAGRTQRTLYLAGASHFTLEFCHSFMPVLYPLFIASMGLTFTQIGLITLVISFTSSFFQPFFSVLSERWGAMRTAALSILWLGLLMALVGFATNFWLLAGLIALASFGSAAFHPAGAVIATSNVQAKRGLTMSIFSVGGNLGAACSPLWMALWTAAFGLRSALTILPFALIGAFVLYRQADESRLAAPRRAAEIGGAIDRRVWLSVGL
nr:MFS transporter [Caldilineaceae bacterium]